MRILVVSHPPLDATLGAAQIALELSQALRDRGHDVVTWSPWPLSAGARGFRASLEQSSRLEALLATTPRFDVVDAPAISITPMVARHGFTVARSVQPDLAYQKSDLGFALRRFSPRFPGDLVKAFRVRKAILGGWGRAGAILCLGSLERSWMDGRFPEWRNKLHHYVAAPSAGLRGQLLAIRALRGKSDDLDSRVLWLGRWAAHKGLDLLRRTISVLRERGGPGVTLAGCGDAPLRTLPKSWIADGSVRVVPHYSRDELPRLLANHSIGLFTSVVEGWGLSLNEMLESGQTVYASNAGGVDDLAPYFPRTLKPLQLGASFAPAVPEDLDGNRYLETFSWPTVAEGYEHRILNRLMSIRIGSKSTPARV